MWTVTEASSAAPSKSAYAWSVQHEDSGERLPQDAGPSSAAAQKQLKLGSPERPEPPGTAKEVRSEGREAFAGLPLTLGKPSVQGMLERLPHQLERLNQRIAEPKTTVRSTNTCATWSPQMEKRTKRWASMKASARRPTCHTARTKTLLVMH